MSNMTALSRTIHILKIMDNVKVIFFYCEIDKPDKNICPPSIYMGWWGGIKMNIALVKRGLKHLLYYASCHIIMSRSNPFCFTPDCIMISNGFCSFRAYLNYLKDDASFENIAGK